MKDAIAIMLSRGWSIAILAILLLIQAGFDVFLVYHIRNSAETILANEIEIHRLKQQIKARDMEIEAYRKSQ